MNKCMYLTFAIVYFSRKNCSNLCTLKNHLTLILSIYQKKTLAGNQQILKNSLRHFLLKKNQLQLAKLAAFSQNWEFISTKAPWLKWLGILSHVTEGRGFASDFGQPATGKPISLSPTDAVSFFKSGESVRQWKETERLRLSHDVPLSPTVQQTPLLYEYIYSNRQTMNLGRIREQLAA